MDFLNCTTAEQKGLTLIERLLPPLVLITPLVAYAEPVTIENFARAETDTYIRANMAAAGVEVGELSHLRSTITPENQTVIRQNQDTLYSGIVLDLTEPAAITLPDIGGRYQSMHVISQDHYMYVVSEPGDYELTQEEVGTRFAMVNFRTFVDPADPEDVAAAQAAQDGIAVAGGGEGPFEAPDWNQKDLTTARQALSTLSELGFNSLYAYGREDEVKPVDFLVGAAAGWGGLPAYGAMYVIESVDANDGNTPHVLNVKDVPVSAFWSLTVYTAEGYLGSNELGVNSYNSVTAERDPDGSITLHFGGCEDRRMNCIPITPGWSYTVRLYEPKDEIIQGSWSFPKPAPAL